MSAHKATTEQTTRSSPAGIYVLCACGWIGTTQDNLPDAMEQHSDHVTAATTKRANTA